MMEKRKTSMKITEISITDFLEKKINTKKLFFWELKCHFCLHETDDFQPSIFPLVFFDKFQAKKSEKPRSENFYMRK